MHFSTITALLLSASVALALPGTPVQERQATPTVYARFFNNGGCQEPWVEDTVFVQNTDGCIPNTITTPFGSTNFTGNTLTRTLRLYTLPGCSDTSGNHFDLKPGVNQCVAQQIKSARFL